jgi:hypothetical protein
MLGYLGFPYALLIVAGQCQEFLPSQAKELAREAAD